MNRRKRFRRSRFDLFFIENEEGRGWPIVKGIQFNMAIAGALSEFSCSYDVWSDCVQVSLSFL